MKRHRFDPLSFVFGIAFIALTFVLSSPQFGLTGERLRWLGAGFLILLGVLMISTSRTRSRDDR